MASRKTDNYFTSPHLPARDALGLRLESGAATSDSFALSFGGPNKGDTEHYLLLKDNLFATGWLAFQLSKAPSSPGTENFSSK